jgi:hypothetical protein
MSHPVLAGHLHGLKIGEAASAAAPVRRIGSDLHVVTDDSPRGIGRRKSYDPGFYNASTLDAHASMCLAVLETIAADPTIGGNEFLVRCLGEYLTKSSEITFEDALEAVRDVALDGLFEYLDEHLDSRNVVLGLISKYKQRAEWFKREALRALAIGGTEGRSGERALAMDLYEFLLDQTVEFFVEPTGASGEPDVVLRESEGRYVIVDAKHIKAGATAGEIRRKLASGFHQVAKYCDDYHQPAGHLVVFSEDTVRMAIELEDADGFRFLSLSGRVVYFTEISIPDAPSASRLGKASEIMVSRADLLSTIAASG